MMKKTLIAMAAVSLLLCVVLLTSCQENTLKGTYRFNEGGNYSEVTFQEDGSFVFTFSPISSYLGVGTFTLKGDKVVLETSDGMNRYVFRITEDGIEFVADESSEFRWYGEFTDGSLFEKCLP